MENEAQQAYLRATRNEQAWLDRRHSLQKQMDLESVDAMTHLKELNADIDLKTANFNRNINEEQERLRAQFQHQDEVYEKY